MATHESTADELTTEDGLRLGQLDDGRPTSTEEFANAEFDEPWTYERVDGRLVVMAPEGTGHVIPSVPWIRKLNAYADRRLDVVQAVLGQAWIHVDDDNTRIADIGVYLGGPLEDLKVPGQNPDLVFEIVSPGKTSRRRDYVEKRAQYEKLGIPEYVIIDRFDKKVTVLTLVDGGYAERVLTTADVYRSPLLPGFEVNLAEVLPR
jgi:Uma2 family endonuclease